MQLKVLRIFSAVACLALVHGVCQHVDVTQDFDVAAYMGRWFEIQRFPTRFEPEGSCVTADYTLTDDAEEPVLVFNRQFNDGTQEYESIDGTARLADDSGEAKLLVSFPVAPFPAPYWVVDTDYTSFALVHSCVSVAGISSKQAWILSRNTTLTPEAIERIYDAIIKNDIQGDRFTITRQDEDCVYL